MANQGISPRVAMDLIRHTDIELTTGPSTEASLLQRHEAVESRPDIGKGKHLKAGSDVLRLTGTDNALSWGFEAQRD